MASTSSQPLPTAVRLTGLGPQTKKSWLKRVLEEHGTVQAINFYHSDRYCVVQYETPVGAKKCQEELQNHNIFLGPNGGGGTHGTAAFEPLTSSSDTSVIEGAGSNSAAGESGLVEMADAEMIPASNMGPSSSSNSDSSSSTAPISVALSQSSGASSSAPSSQVPRTEAENSEPAAMSVETVTADVTTSNIDPRLLGIGNAPAASTSGTSTVPADQPSVSLGGQNASSSNILATQSNAPSIPAFGGQDNITGTILAPQGNVPTGSAFGGDSSVLAQSNTPSGPTLSGQNGTTNNGNPFPSLTIAETSTATADVYYMDIDMDMGTSEPTGPPQPAPSSIFPSTIHVSAQAPLNFANGEQMVVHGTLSFADAISPETLALVESFSKDNNIAPQVMNGLEPLIRALEQNWKGKKEAIVMEAKTIIEKQASDLTLSVVQGKIAADANNALRHQNHTLTGENNALTEQNKKLQDEKNHAVSQLDSLSRQNAASQARTATRRGTNRVPDSHFKQALDSSIKELAEAEARNREAAKTILELVSENKESKLKITSLQQELEEKNKAHESSLESILKNTRELEKKTSECKGLQEENNGLRTSNEAKDELLSQKDETILRLESDKSTLEQKTKALKELKASNEEFSRENSELKESNTNLQGQIGDNERYIVRLRTVVHNEKAGINYEAQFRLNKVNIARLQGTIQRLEEEKSQRDFPHASDAALVAQTKLRAQIGELEQKVQTAEDKANAVENNLILELTNAEYNRKLEVGKAREAEGKAREAERKAMKAITVLSSQLEHSDAKVKALTVAAAKKTSSTNKSSFIKTFFASLSSLLLMVFIYFLLFVQHAGYFHGILESYSTPISSAVAGSPTCLNNGAIPHAMYHQPQPWNMDSVLEDAIVTEPISFTTAPSLQTANPQPPIESTSTVTITVTQPGPTVTALAPIYQHSGSNWGVITQPISSLYSSLAENVPSFMENMVATYGPYFVLLGMENIWHTIRGRALVGGF